MPLPAQYARVGLVYGSDDKRPFVELLWYVPEGTIALGDGVSESLALATAISNQVSGPFKNVICIEDFFFGINVSLNLSGVIFDVAYIGDAGNGTISGDSLPDYAATIIRKRTNHGGRTGRGRWFVGCVPEAFTDTSNLLNDTTLAVYNTLGASMFNLVSTTGFDYSSQLHSVKDNEFYIILGVQTQKVLATQRRRRLRQAF